MNIPLQEMNIRLPKEGLPSYIAVEGPIGVGKTTLAQNLADTLGFDTLFEQPMLNPFLEKFYRDQAAYALPTQLHFLFQRVSQMEEIKQRDLFHHSKVSDFILDKDPLFAEVNLNSDELALYKKVYQNLRLQIPDPDITVYLQAPSDVLVSRVIKRGISSEQNISEQYLQELNEIYMRFFHNYQKSPLLIVNAADIDFSSDQQPYEKLVEAILNHAGGRQFYNPTNFPYAQAIR